MVNTILLKQAVGNSGSVVTGWVMDHQLADFRSHQSLYSKWISVLYLLAGISHINTLIQSDIQACLNDSPILNLPVSVSNHSGLKPSKSP